MIEIAKVGDVLPGGMLYVKAGDKEFCLCNVNGEYYAVARRCGHMNAPLNMGTLDGYILTCGLHHIAFDVRTGKALNPMVPHYSPPGPKPTTVDNYGNWVEELIKHTTICDVKTYRAVVDGDSIKVDI
jgi:nitrite reductase/ring-hydroxylating ferredoxin subunit